MIQVLNLTDDSIAERILLIQKLAYRIEADLIGFDGIPALHETITEIRNSAEIFLGYFVDDVLAGVLSYSVDAKILDIGRLVVHPDYFRLGIGQALVKHVESLKNVETIVVLTGAANMPARKLYEGLNYQLIRQRILVEGLQIAEYVKQFS
jgi:ribosomal protein S18 acetylase RimI-like enzyme